MSYVYYIDGEKFIAENYGEISGLKISSPDENTPAFENLKTGFKFWCEINEQIHRLTGPAEIYPNPELYFDAINLPKTDKVLWFLQN
jgi:hypothetical protein